MILIRFRKTNTDAGRGAGARKQGREEGGAQSATGGRRPVGDVGDAGWRLAALWGNRAALDSPVQFVRFSRYVILCHGLSRGPTFLVSESSDSGGMRVDTWNMTSTVDVAK